MPKFDFAGWATRNNLKCNDGRTIREGAFADQDGEVVPLVWNHQHNSPDNILGHALLRNEKDGVRAYCEFNDTESGQTAKSLVGHGDIESLSIFANNLKQKAGDVLHGAIKEVSLVVAGANPGAYIDDIAFAHGAGGELEEIVLYTGEGINFMEDVIEHAAKKEDETKETDSDGGEDDNKEPEKKPEPKKEEKSDDGDGEETVGDIINSMNEKQRTVLEALVGQALSEGGAGEKESNKEDDEMKHNVFDPETQQEEQNYLSHSDMVNMIEDAKSHHVGSLRQFVSEQLDGGTLAHGIAPIPTQGMDVATGTQTYGLNDVDMLYPEYRNLNSPPEFLGRNMDWVPVVMSGVHHTPFTRIKSMYADITADEARAKGYLKGNRKTEEVFSLMKRTTTPTTIYKKQKFDREDIIDITDFDVIAWIKQEMRQMLNEEIARAILIGDGRLASSDDKIQEANIRPIVKDDPLFNIKYVVNNFSPKNFIDEVVRSRKQYKGSGNPIFFTTEDLLTEMLLIEDGVGHKLYKTEAELATALRVSRIVTVEVMEGYQIDGKDLLGVIVNLSDYNVGTDKGGEITMFDDFDIDFNQYKYLMETRMSGALIKPFSAITLLKGTSGKNKVTTTLDVDNTVQP